MKRVAVLPFFNQSDEPTVDGDFVGAQYYASLQSVPGFEVLPMGVTKTAWMQYSLRNGEPRTGPEFQALARHLGVEAIVVGAVTDFEAFYPPRMAMTVHWYAANEGFHAIPPGYGLPWGTEQEKQIPKRVVREAEFELARSQLKTQSPVSGSSGSGSGSGIAPVGHEESLAHPETFDLAPPTQTMPDGHDVFGDEMQPGHAEDRGIVIATDGFAGDGFASDGFAGEWEAPMPPDWPDPTDLIPDGPSPVRPIAIPNSEPVLTHTRIYRGDDPYVTGRLADYVETGDDARSSGWQGYLKRTDDFVRFCCHLHITEMLESRGGRDQSDFIVRWSLSRY